MLTLHIPRSAPASTCFPQQLRQTRFVECAPSLNTDARIPDSILQFVGIRPVLFVIEFSTILLHHLSTLAVTSGAPLLNIPSIGKGADLHHHRPQSHDICP
jgi:hypothetical protein